MIVAVEAETASKKIVLQFIQFSDLNDELETSLVLLVIVQNCSLHYVYHKLIFSARDPN